MNVKQRLAFYKSKVGQHGVADWREVAAARHYWSKSPARKKCVLGAPAPGTQRRFVSLDDVEKIGLRDVGAAHDIVRIKHTGWYYDEFQDGTFSGHVWQLPARNGESLYLGGYVESESNGAVIDFTVAYEKETAAVWGDDLAQREAEESRDYCAREAVRTRVDELKERAIELRAELKNLFKVRRDYKHWRNVDGVPIAARRTLCDVVSEKLVSLIEESRETRKTIARLIEENSLEALDHE